MKGNSYVRLGVALSVGGAIMSPLFYFLLDSAPLTAFAMSAVMLGIVSAMLGNSRSALSPEASQMMLRTGLDNVASLLEELGVCSRAIYNPPSDEGGRARALIPLSENGRHAVRLPTASNRLITRYGPGADDIGLVVTTPGTMSLDGLAGMSAESPDADKIEGALTQILVGTMDLADSVSVKASGQKLIVEIVHPRLKYDNVWYNRCLGSPLASIAATVGCHALRKPVVISSEEADKKRLTVTIEALQ